jgi:hypothetical protein
MKAAISSLYCTDEGKQEALFLGGLCVKAKKAGTKRSVSYAPRGYYAATQIRFNLF